jgi:hypothetical protein
MVNSNERRVEMPKGKKSDGKQYKAFDGGKIADKEKNTVYSARQVEQMYKASQENRRKK